MSYYIKRRAEIIGPNRIRRPRRDVLARQAARAEAQRARELARIRDQQRAARRLLEHLR